MSECPGRGISFLILLQLYLAGRANGLFMDANLLVMGVLVLAVAYVAFKKKYYWMHEEYLKGLGSRLHFGGEEI